MPTGVCPYVPCDQSPTDSPSQHALIAATTNLLGSFHSLSTSELRALATNLDFLAEYVEHMAQQKEVRQSEAEVHEVRTHACTAPV